MASKLIFVFPKPVMSPPGSVLNFPYYITTDADKKSLFPKRKQAFPNYQPFLRQPGYPPQIKKRIRSFAPSGYPEFTFSEIQTS
jgi:hypothetical protein